jgi:hypothetical protein
MSRKNRKTGQTKSHNRLLTSPTPELIAALSLLGASLQVTEVAVAAESPAASGVKLAETQTYKPTTSNSQTNAQKENSATIQSKSIKWNTMKETHTDKPNTVPQSNTIKGAPAPTVKKQP